MKKLILILSTVLFFSMTACAKSGKPETNDTGDGMNITIEITNGKGEKHSLNASLSQNKSAQAFYELLQKGPLTVKMTDYGNFEKVGSLGTSLPRTDTQITTEAGDLILYQGNQITIYYDVNRWNFTRLGKIKGISQEKLKSLLGKGDVSAVFSISE